MRNRFQSLCPYFAMFPEAFVQKHLVWSEPGDVVLDPFSGRGTTVFEALLARREAIAGDTNPVAVCVSRAKADPPTLDSVLKRIDELEEEQRSWHPAAGAIPSDEFFDLCFESSTLRQVVFLRQQLQWRARRTDCMIAALALGCVHGESHRTPWCFSNRMPRTISTKPAYSVKWWRARGCVPPKRDVFSILRAVARYRYESPLPALRGRVADVDARMAANRFPTYFGRVALVITSPPYLDTTNYREDQWLRLWFLGEQVRGALSVRVGDDRHGVEESYWTFLTEAWAGIAPLLREGARIVVRIGGRHIERDTVGDDLLESLREGVNRPVRIVDKRSDWIVKGQRQAFRPGAIGTLIEHDFVFAVT